MVVVIWNKQLPSHQFYFTCLQVWTALLNYGYVGCIRDLFIDGQSKDVRRMAEVQKAAGVKPSCSKEPPKQCLSNPCQNNGVCREGWNRYVCDCSGTGYLGRSCERGKTSIHIWSLSDFDEWVLILSVVTPVREVRHIPCLNCLVEIQIEIKIKIVYTVLTWRILGIDKVWFVLKGLCRVGISCVLKGLCRVRN